MKRQIGHPAANPYRLTRAAIQAHREHLPTPFLGCPVCALRAPVEPLKIRWMSPAALTGSDAIGAAAIARQPGSASESIRGGWAASHALSSASFERR